MLEILRNAGGGLATLRYDYNQIEAEHRETVMEAAVEIRQRTKRANDDILAVGQKLCEVKELLPHGKFVAWAEDEFGMSARTAQRLMLVAERFASKNDTVTLLSTSVLYLLASPSTPDDAIDATVDYARANGSSPTKAETQRIIAEHRPARTATAKETEVAVWRAAGHDGRKAAAAMLAWMNTATAEDYRKVFVPGVGLDPDLLTGCIAKVRGELQRMAEREAVKETQVVRGKVVAWSPPTTTTTDDDDEEIAADGAVVVADYEESVGGEIEPAAPPPDIVLDIPQTPNRTQRLRYLMTAFKEAMRLLPEYGQLTGNFSQSERLKRELSTAIQSIEGNLV